VAFSWLFIIPYFADLPLLSIPKLQPDLGYALFIGVIIGTISGFVQYFIKAMQIKKYHARKALLNWDRKR